MPSQLTALPPVVDRQTWRAALDELRKRERAATYRTWRTNGRGTEQLGHSFGLIDGLPWGRQEGRVDAPDGWPSRTTYSGWLDSPAIVAASGPMTDEENA